jgi:hypothetical protein
MDDFEGEADGDGGVDGIAAILQDLHADGAGQGVSRHHHSVAPLDGNGLPREAPGGIGMFDEGAASGDQDECDKGTSAHSLFCTLTVRSVNV